jgi:hypothetical protein
VNALEKAGFAILREARHTIMTDGICILVISRHNPINAITMGGIVRDAGLNLEQLKELL